MNCLLSCYVPCIMFVRKIVGVETSDVVVPHFSS
jgi:hypothetical protein